MRESMPSYVLKAAHSPFTHLQNNLVGWGIVGVVSAGAPGPILRSNVLRKGGGN